MLKESTTEGVPVPDFNAAVHPYDKPPVQLVPDQAGDVTVIIAAAVVVDVTLALEEMKSLDREAATKSVGESPTLTPSMLGADASRL